MKRGGKIINKTNNKHNLNWQFLYNKIVIKTINTYKKETQTRTTNNPL